MLNSLPPLLYLPQTELDGRSQPSPFPLPNSYSLETEVSLRQVELKEGEWKEAGKIPKLFSLCPPLPS